MTYLLVLLIVISADAKPKPAARTPRCRAALTVDKKYARIMTFGTRTSEYNVQLTHLLKDAFAPVLREVRDRVATLSLADIQRELEDWTPAVKTIRSPSGGGCALFSKTAQLLQYDGAFAGRFTTETNFRAPFTEHSQKVMRRLLRAVSYLQALEIAWENELAKTPAFRTAGQLLNDHTFGQKSLMRTLTASNDAVILAAAQLIADPVPPFDAATLLDRAMRAHDGGVSPAVRLSLALPPAVLSPYGDRMYVRHPLRWQDGKLSLSARLREFIARARVEFNRAEPEHYEFGHGCPVAHREPGRSTSALQDYLDAVMHVYDLLEESERPAFGPMRDDRTRAVR